MSVPYVSIIPQLAPLSQPMMAVVLENTGSTKKKRAFFPEASEWNSIVKRVEEKRIFVYDLMNPVVRSGDLSTNWLIEQITQFTPKSKTKQAPGRPISAETISRWRASGLLLYAEKNHPEAASTAALLTLRLLVTNKARGWTPSVFLQEPQWWCWRQDFPDAPTVPCPVPLPRDIPRHALLWTPWTGAAWNPAWLQFGALGSARWASIHQDEDGDFRWDLEENDLLVWGGQDIIKYERGLLDAMAKMARHTTATLLLLSLASSRLENIGV